MDGDVLPKDVLGTDAQPRRFALVFQVLRRGADDTAGIKVVLVADGRGPGQMHVWPEPAIRSDDNRAVNDRVRAHLHARVKLRRRVDYRRRVNHSGATANTEPGRLKTGIGAPLGI